MTCPLAKLTKLSFLLSDSHAASRFDLVHVDTWGPYKVSTRGKYRYLLTLVDDFSRVTWVYLLQNKSEYLFSIISFYNYVKTQFGTGIKCIRSDNALEFTDKSCREFYVQHGICHETSCVYRPQQNARVKRKHRQILQVARALKFQAGLPLSYWGDCALTAVYIINRIPIIALNNRVPYEVLFEKPVDYEGMNIFGCLDFAVNSTHKNDKFQPRGIPCLFLHYPPTQKGFRLLNLLTKKTFVSRYVVFNEHVFQFNSNKVNPYMQPLPLIEQVAKPIVYYDDMFCILPGHVEQTDGSDEADNTLLSLKCYTR